MSDADIHRTIAELVAEEHRLRAGEVSGDERERLTRVEESLDQCWDLLRQRRAKSDSGENPNDAEARPVSEVEGYKQ